jgi:hypothetical protein
MFGIIKGFKALFSTKVIFNHFTLFGIFYAFYVNSISKDFNDIFAYFKQNLPYAVCLLVSFLLVYIFKKPMLNDKLDLQEFLMRGFLGFLRILFSIFITICAFLFLAA